MRDAGGALENANVLRDGEIEEHIGALRNIPEPGPRPLPERKPRNVHAPERDLPGSRCELPGDGAEERALARAARADHAHDAAGLHADVDAVENAQTVEG